MKGPILHTHRPLAVAALAAAALSAAGSAQAAATPRADTAHVHAIIVAPGYSRDGYLPAIPESSTGFKVGQDRPLAVTDGDAGVNVIRGDYWATAENQFTVNGMSEVSQTFATVPGTAYTVSYTLAGATGGTTAAKTGIALIDGQEVQDFSVNIDRTTAMVMPQHFTFMATRPATTLTFAGTAEGPRGPVIDNIRIQANY
jgi:uncharacterized protein DUF642